MTNPELSNEFDVLYNSITSNQAPGLDEYEKSVFLTKAQDEVVKSYFNPRSNKTQEGFDGNEKRQIDFSMIMRSLAYRSLRVAEKASDPPTENLPESIDTMGQLMPFIQGTGTNLYIAEDVVSKINQNNMRISTEGAVAVAHWIHPFVPSFFDMRENTESVALESDIMMFVNEYVEVERNEVATRLTVLPINYTEYSRLMSKPYKRPLKNQAWRLLDNSEGIKKAELVVGPTDSITKYVIRYVKRPRAIRLIDFEGVTIDGGSTEQSCELDPILHEEILQRAVELAKAAYSGDLQSQVALGNASQTNIGFVASSK